MKTSTQLDFKIALLHSVRQWLEAIEVHDPKIARLLCRLSPACCPFERDINFFGHTVFHVPFLCKLNPLYEQVIGLRFRCLSYLVEQCGEDLKLYC